MNFFKNLWNYLYDVYLRVDGSYENIGFEKTPLFSLRLTVLGIFVGAIIACLAVVYNRRVLGGAVRGIISSEANSPESAKTVDELGFSKKILIKNAFRFSASMRRVVKCVGAQEFYKDQDVRREEHEKKRESGEKLPKFREIEYIIDTNTDRFYIPEECKEKAQMKFGKKGGGWLSTLIWIVVLLVMFFVLLLVLPMIFGAADKFLGSFK